MYRYKVVAYAAERLLTCKQRSCQNSVRFTVHGIISQRVCLLARRGVAVWCFVFPTKTSCRIQYQPSTTYNVMTSLLRQCP